MSTSHILSDVRALDPKVKTTLVVAALGYFVDIFDLLLFAAVRVDSLTSLGLTGQAQIDAAVTILNAQYAGLLVGGICWGLLGDVLCGFYSQHIQSRRKAIFIFNILGIFSVTLFLTCAHSSPLIYFACMALAAVSAGIWAMHVQVAAELFGTNFRSTATGIVPNATRATLIPMVFAFKYLVPMYGAAVSAAIVAAVVYGLALLAVYVLDETCNRDLDFYEK